MPDILTEAERSERMSKVRSTSNKSTELLVVAKLIEIGITGWERQPKGIVGKPDFVFSKQKVVIFVDGCFWHACPICKRHLPATRVDYWENKIEGNHRRDNKNRRELRKQGFHVMRIWEHEIKKGAWVKRLQMMLHKEDGEI